MVRVGSVVSRLEGVRQETDFRQGRCNPVHFAGRCGARFVFSVCLLVSVLTTEQFWKPLGQIENASPRCVERRFSRVPALITICRSLFAMRAAKLRLRRFDVATNQLYFGGWKEKSILRGLNFFSKGGCMDFNGEFSSKQREFCANWNALWRRKSDITPARCPTCRLCFLLQPRCILKSSHRSR